MAYQEGDTSPPHTNVHNDVRTQLDQLSTEFEIPVVLPPVVGLGDVGHVDHHNLFTTAIAELSKHECEDGLEGLGGWAEITEVTGSPKRYAYNDGPGGVGGFDWVAFEWTADGSLTTQAGGLVDALVVGGGGGNYTTPGYGGRVIPGLHNIGANNPIVCGKGAGRGSSGSQSGDGSYLGDIYTGLVSISYGANAFGAGATPAFYALPYVSDITGVDKEYAGANKTNAQQTPGLGQGGAQNNNGGNGSVTVRVPAAQAAGVDPGSWVTRIDYYAEVTDGIVTDLYQEKFYGDDSVRTENGRYASPEQPDDLIPCDPSVAEGWTYADGEFTPPPPDPSWREEAIEALKQQIKDLQKDAK